MILLALRPASLTHKNPKRRKIICGMGPVGRKDRLINLKMFFVEYRVCVLTVAVVKNTLISFSLCCALQ